MNTKLYIITGVLISTFFAFLSIIFLYVIFLVGIGQYNNNLGLALGAVFFIACFGLIGYFNARRDNKKGLCGKALYIHILVSGISALLDLIFAKNFIIIAIRFLIYFLILQAGSYLYNRIHHKIK